MDTNLWYRSAIIELTAKLTGLGKEELYSTFNMGIGMVLVVKQENKDQVLDFLEKEGLKAWEIGKVISGDKGILR